MSIARALCLLFEGGHDILKFYKYRDLLGRNVSPKQQLAKMREIVERGIRQSTEMIILCEKDNRLGYHSEAEGYKFFPEKLTHRISQLKELLETEFVVVQKRIDAKLPPLAFYQGEEKDVEHYQMSKEGLAQAQWQYLSDREARFRVAYDDEKLEIEFMAPYKAKFMVVPEFQLLCPEIMTEFTPGKEPAISSYYTPYWGLFGDSKEKKRARWQLETLSGDRTHMRVVISRNSIVWDGLLPMRMLVSSWELDSGLQKAIWCEEKNPRYRLGIPYSTCELGWLMP